MRFWLVKSQSHHCQTRNCLNHGPTNPFLGGPLFTWEFFSSAGSGGDAAERVSKRLALRLGQPVAVSWNVEGDDILHAWAEKQLVNEIKKRSLTQSMAAVVLWTRFSLILSQHDLLSGSSSNQLIVHSSVWRSKATVSMQEMMSLI